MENRYYTREKNIQILISLLKQYKIKRVIASPGSSNEALVISLQHDDFFEIYSCVDERSAAYMACGMVAETNEPVLITCTEATSSRDYMPGLTEAYYRKLPVLAVMTSHGETMIGSYEPQVLDNTITPNDTSVYNFRIPLCNTKTEERSTIVHINEAINKLYLHGGGPVRLVLEIRDISHYDIKALPSVPIIRQYTNVEPLPPLPSGNVIVFIGSHKVFTKEETTVIETFCETNNGVVIADITSNYNGKYKVHYALVGSQEGFATICPNIDLIIYIGTVSGDYYGSNVCRFAKNNWLINQDGVYRDRFCTLTAVITMDEMSFFEHYSKGQKQDMAFYQQLKKQTDKILSIWPELPFSNLWLARKSFNLIPKGCEIYAAINNSLRSWNFVGLPEGVTGFCNVGGYGIDGGLSSMIGAALTNPNKLYFGICGDLQFFYDMNVLGNRHIGNNIRILLVNNGHGQEFRFYQNPASQFGEETDLYVAAGGHFGCKSKDLVKHYAEDLGYEYMTADSKESFISNCENFFSSTSKDKPVIFEVFTNNDEENEALRMTRSIVPSKTKKLKEYIRSIAGEKAIDLIKSARNAIKD